MAHTFNDRTSSSPEGESMQPCLPEVHFLDAVPFTLGLPGARDLLELLVAAYDEREGARAIAGAAGVNLGRVNWEQPIEDAWFAALREASARGLLRGLVKRVLGDDAVREHHGRISELTAPVPTVEAPAGRAREPIGVGEDAQAGGHPATINVAFLAEGLRVAASVVRLSARHRTGSYHGNGLLVADGWILTNHHVLYDWRDGASPAQSIQIRFGYEVGLDRLERPCDIYRGVPASIAGDRGDDWAAVKIDGPIGADYPILKLSPSRPAAAGDRVYVVQHPYGGPKQLGLHDNDVTFVDDRVVHSRTEIAGSSGAPIFNEGWEVVALHHRWEETGRVLDRRVFRNEAIRIERIAAGLGKSGIL
jgi:Trypsin-like peptidase domain/Effector-associated domain 1